MTDNTAMVPYLPPEGSHYLHVCQRKHQNMNAGRFLLHLNRANRDRRASMVAVAVIYVIALVGNQGRI